MVFLCVSEGGSLDLLLGMGTFALGMGAIYWTWIKALIYSLYIWTCSSCYNILCPPSCQCMITWWWFPRFSAVSITLAHRGAWKANQYTRIHAGDSDINKININLMFLLIAFATACINMQSRWCSPPPPFIVLACKLVHFCCNCRNFQVSEALLIQHQSMVVFTVSVLDHFY